MSPRLIFENRANLYEAQVSDPAEPLQTNAKQSLKPRKPQLRRKDYSNRMDASQPL